MISTVSLVNIVITSHNLFFFSFLVRPSKIYSLITALLTTVTKNYFFERCICSQRSFTSG